MSDDTQTQDPNAALAGSVPAVNAGTQESSTAPTASPDTAGNGEGSNGPAATAPIIAVVPVIKPEHKNGFFKRLEHVPAEILHDIVKAFEALEADVESSQATA